MMAPSKHYTPHPVAIYKDPWHSTTIHRIFAKSHGAPLQPALGTAPVTPPAHTKIKYKFQPVKRYKHPGCHTGTQKIFKKLQKDPQWEAKKGTLRPSTRPSVNHILGAGGVSRSLHPCERCIYEVFYENSAFRKIHLHATIISCKGTGLEVGY